MDRRAFERADDVRAVVSSAVDEVEFTVGADGKCEQVSTVFLLVFGLLRVSALRESFE